MQDFTAFGKTDPNSRFGTITATSLPYTGFTSNEVAHVERDYGVNVITDPRYFEGTVNIASATGGTQVTMNIGFSDTLGVVSADVNDAGIYFVNSSAQPTILSFGTQLRQNSVGSGVQSAVNLALATTYGFRTGVLSSLGGQFGAAVAQIFNSSALTTCLGSVVTARTANGTYRWLYAAQSNTTGDARSFTGTHSSFSDLITPAAGTDLTAGTETDVSNRIVRWANCTVVTALNIAPAQNAATFTALNYGTGAIGDYTVSGILNITAFASGAIGPMFNILSVTNAGADAAAATVLQGVDIEWATSTTYKPYIQENVGGTPAYSTVGPTLTVGNPYSFVLNRTGSTLTLKIYNDLVLTNNAGISQVGSTVTWTGRATTAYQYLMPVASHLNGTTSRSSTFTLGGVNLNLFTSYALSCASGTYTYSGKAATLTYVAGSQAYTLTCASGVYTYTGIAAALSYIPTDGVYTLACEVGHYTYSGKAVALTYVPGGAPSETFGFTAFGTDGVELTGQTCYLEAFDASSNQWNWNTQVWAVPNYYALSLPATPNRSGNYSAVGSTKNWNGEISLHGWYVSTQDGLKKNYNTVAEYVNSVRVIRTTLNTAIGLVPSAAQIATAVVDKVIP